MNQIKSVICLIGCCLSIHLGAQNIPLGTWRTHAAYQMVKSLALGNNKVYAASSNGFFYVDQTDNTLNTMSKISGLSDTEISQIAYHEALKTLVVTYQNGNIDLLKSDEIVNIPTIKTNKNITESKQVNHILIQGNNAYLSTDFGIVVLDLSKNEIKETYQNLGVNGRSIAIKAATFSQDSVYIATENGVYYAPFNGSVNLQDFNAWQRFEPSTGIDTLEFNYIVSFASKVYVGRTNYELYEYAHNNQWTKVSLPAPVAPNTGQIRDVRASNGQLLLSIDHQLLLLNAQNQVTIFTNSKLNSPQVALVGANGVIWIGDGVNGLVQKNGTTYNAFFPNGPASAESRHLYAYQSQILALSGGYQFDETPLNSSAGFYLFDNAQWKNYNAFDPLHSHAIANVKDWVAAGLNSQDQQLYIGSFQSGLYVFKDNALTSVAGSTLRASTDNTVRVGGITTDVEGNLWVTNPSDDIARRFLHKRDVQREWSVVSAPTSATGAPLGILSSFGGYLWMRLSPAASAGIWVYDPQLNRSKVLNTTVNNGNLPSPRVYSMVQDKEGQIWVGTDKGVTVFFNPADAFQAAIDASKPIFDGQNLLRAEKVSTIAVDGGNRKWMGTNNGLWLFNPDGTQLVHHFTTKNSPLPSDIIYDVTIQPQTGEVFVATDKGLVSYRGTATTGEQTHQEVKVFPNPVRPNFNGLLGISGLVDDAKVKITDVSGKLIYQTQAQGGTVSWDLRDYTGHRAKTGIYLLFSTNADGTETLVTKIAVIE
ncbi:type IX secretion system anionic LPS delivery protein PorZ [Microscilla marina]|uniref:PorZ N-terminal beta-propeller domain-containing protein n=1 Tax=Microscilla marina ATCC 23134 TaxID=313606 RepID=A1ZU35_MICM2|nr:two-component regulator propeller domain-containing protein [Microscilla marina]EAY26148.1 hypothetical protein M23134_06021 [Microscilla marina ATCC 23134]